jgi:hypothetical protein
MGAGKYKFEHLGKTKDLAANFDQVFDHLRTMRGAVPIRALKPNAKPGAFRFVIRSETRIKPWGAFIALSNRSP